MPRAMTEQTYFVLTALLDGPLHGYAVIKRVEDLSQARVRLAAGTLASGAVGAAPVTRG